MRFTDEQQAAIDLAATRESFSLVAPAGSGKSATAVGMADRLKNYRVLYLVYNTEARLEAEARFADMPWVDVRTTSSFGWRAFADWRQHEGPGVDRARAKAIAERYAERMNPKAQAMPAREVARRLKLQAEDFGDGLVLDGYTQARLVYDTIERWCNSDRPRISMQDVPLAALGIDDAAQKAACGHVARLAQRVWQRSIEPDSVLRFTMNYAFKQVSASGRDFGYDVILMDEAQDGNDATMAFLRNQKAACPILIGDPAQALYGWRGATDQMLHHPGPRLYLTQSWRFGPAVAEEAMKHLAHTGTGVVIRGNPAINDRVTEGEMASPDVVLTRTNIGTMEWAMSYLRSGQRVALVKDRARILSLVFAAGDLMAGRRPSDYELCGFDKWPDVVEYSEEPGGGHLKPLVRLVQAYGVSRLIDACKAFADYNRKNPMHDVAVTTCHSIKGLEWNRVKIGDDFREPEPMRDPESGMLRQGLIDPEEAMVNYVAVSRAKQHLDRSGVAWIDNYSAPSGAKALTVTGHG